MPYTLGKDLTAADIAMIRDPSSWSTPIGGTSTSPLGTGSSAGTLPQAIGGGGQQAGSGSTLLRDWPGREGTIMGTSQIGKTVTGTQPVGTQMVRKTGQTAAGKTAGGGILPGVTKQQGTTGAKPPVDTAVIPGTETPASTEMMTQQPVVSSWWQKNKKTVYIVGGSVVGLTVVVLLARALKKG